METSYITRQSWPKNCPVHSTVTEHLHWPPLSLFTHPWRRTLSGLYSPSSISYEWLSTLASIDHFHSAENEYLLLHWPSSFTRERVSSLAPIVPVHLAVKEHLLWLYCSVSFKCEGAPILAPLLFHSSGKEWPLWHPLSKFIQLWKSIPEHGLQLPDWHRAHAREGRKSCCLLIPLSLSHWHTHTHFIYKSHTHTFYL